MVSHVTPCKLQCKCFTLFSLSKLLGLACFEGMKAYKTIPDESLCLFRPDRNMHRLSNSMERLQLPGHDFDKNELIECIKELVRVDKKWIPTGEGYSLYLRPTVIATHRFLGLSAPENLLLYVITSPVGPYYKSGFDPVRLTADSHYVRAWPGGTGNCKVRQLNEINDNKYIHHSFDMSHSVDTILQVAGNYGPTMKPQALATEAGYQQVVWLFGEDDTITEVGAMNIFFFLINKETGRKELVTPPLTRGDILPGVTRESILELARSWDEFDVVERFPTMPEIRQAAEDGRLLESFGAGTAAVVSPISCIQYKGVDIDIPATGDLTKRVWNEITGIQYGKMEDRKGWNIRI